MSHGSGLPTSGKKSHQRKLSTQFEIHSSIGNQSQFKFMMGENLVSQGTLSGGNLMSKTLENENTIAE